MDKALKENEVLLWGLEEIPKAKLAPYDKGNKNPNSIKRKPVQEAPKEAPKKVVREYDIEEDYGIEDIPFLNKEYERIDKLLETAEGDEIDELEEKQEKLYELLEGLEGMKKMQGGALPKGSEEAKQQMIKVREAKEKPKAIPPKAIPKEKPKVASKVRITKGSEEAKSFAQRMQEAKKRKAEEKAKLEPVKQKELKGKPWFYIGDIPKGYREATEDEALIAHKVSAYGKYKIDSEKYRLYNDYNILLNPDKTDKELVWTLNGFKRRTLTSLKEIEILKSKLENDKYKDKHSELKSKLEYEKDLRKHLQAVYNFYYKILCERKNKPYERQKFKLEEKEIKFEPSDTSDWKPQTNIDPRKINEDISEDYLFRCGNDTIELSSDYFDENVVMKSKYAKKLFKKGIMLDRNYYNLSDWQNMVYHLIMKGEGVVHRMPPKHISDIVQSVVFDKKHWTIPKAKKWLKEHDYYYDMIDRKTDQLRFRQYNPEDLYNRHYISKKLSNNVMLIISVKNE